MARNDDRLDEDKLWRRVHIIPWSGGSISGAVRHGEVGGGRDGRLRIIGFRGVRRGEEAETRASSTGVMACGRSWRCDASLVTPTGHRRLPRRRPIRSSLRGSERERQKRLCRGFTMRKGELHLHGLLVVQSVRRRRVRREPVLRSSFPSLLWWMGVAWLRVLRHCKCLCRMRSTSLR